MSTTSGTDPGEYIVTVTDGNGCQNSASGLLIENSLPVVTLSLDVDAVCSGVGLTALTGGVPSGGIYSGIGVSDGSIDPTAVGSVIPASITYTYTNSNNCTNSATDIFTVNSLPNVMLTLGTASSCANSSPILLTGGLPSGSGGSYSGLGVSVGKIDPAIVGGGNTGVVTYTYIDSNGCSSNASDNFTVEPTINGGQISW